MADTWSLMERMRPRVRPAGVAPEPTRPLLRPDNLGETQVAGSQDAEQRPHPRPEGIGTVPEQTQAEATVAEAIPLDRTALIGLFHGPDGSSALLRLSSGSIIKVAAGENIDGGRVTAISQDGLRLQKNGQEIILSMPG